MPVFPRRILAFNSHSYSLQQLISDSKVVVPRTLPRVFGDASSTRSCYRFLKPNFGTHGLHSSSRSFVLKWEPAACRCVLWSLVVGSVLAITIVVVRESRQFPQSDYFYTTTTQPRENTITINLGLRAPLSSTLLLRL